MERILQPGVLLKMHPGLAAGAYDLLLAGQAVALGLVLVTRNLREFQRVGGLRLENWED